MAKLLDRLLRRTPPAVKADMFSNYSSWWMAGGDASTFYGSALLYSDSSQGRISAAKYNVWASNCVGARAETVAGVELKLYKKTDNEDEEDEEIIDHPCLQVLSDVNPINLDDSSFTEQIERQLSIHGEAYIHKVRDGNELAELYILPAQHLEPVPDVAEMVRGYRYLGTRTLPREDILRIYYPDDENPLLARSPMSGAISAINNYALSDLSQQGIDRRGGQGGGIVSVDFNTVAQDPQRFMAEWDAKRSDPANAGRDAFVPSGSSYMSGVLTAQQQQREERAQRLIREIMAALRVPPSLAGDYRDASVLANAAQQSTNFWQTFVLFELKRIAKGITKGILWAEYEGSKDEGLYLEFDVSGVSALNEGEGDKAERENVEATTSDMLYAAGLISLNEARVRINEDEIDDPHADEVMQPTTDDMSMEEDYEAEEDAEDEELGAEVDDLLSEVGTAAKAVGRPERGDMDGDGIFNESEKKPKKNLVRAKINKTLEVARRKKLKKKKGKGGKPKKTEAQKLAEREKKKEERKQARIAKLTEQRDKLREALIQLQGKDDPSNLRRRISKAIERLENRINSINSGNEAGVEKLLGEAATKAVPDVGNEYVWIGMYLTTGDARAIKLGDDELPTCKHEDKHHVTIALFPRYLFREEDQTALMLGMGEIAMNTNPVSAVVSGLGVFEQPDERVLYASVDSPWLDIVRERVVAMLSKAGYSATGDHGFTPHITLAYCPPDTDLSNVSVPRMNFTLPMLTLRIGDANYSYPLPYGITTGDIRTTAARTIAGDMVGLTATKAGEVLGVIESVKRFGTFKGVKATKSNPAVFVAGVPYSLAEIGTLEVEDGDADKNTD